MTAPGADAGDTPLQNRKRDHLRAVLSDDVGFATLSTGLERIQLQPRALPERDLHEVDLGLTVFGRRLAAPLLISCMTGGVSEAGPVNRALAVAAQRNGVAMGLGSGRAILEDPSTAASFRVRDVAPDVLVLANLGAVQLHQYTSDDCARLVEECEADALVLHLNAVQEAVQPGGDLEFGGLVARIAATAAALGARGCPVVVKEVGFGMSDADIGLLLDAGVDGIDVAGAGGTNWARVEGTRDSAAAAVAAAFADWGRPTAACVVAAAAAIAQRARPTVLIGSGGLRDGVDALKVLCLGADLAGIARGLVAAGVQGPEAADEAVRVLVRQVTVAAWAAGAASIDDLGVHLLAHRPVAPAGALDRHGMP